MKLIDYNMQYIYCICQAKKQYIIVSKQNIFASVTKTNYDGQQTARNMATNIRMKVARVEKGWTQQELANRVEATRQTIGLIEKGEYNPTLKLCVRIARALDRTLDQLFWEESQ